MPWTIDELDTPSVLIDLDRVEANLPRAQAYADAHGLKLRPHIKTHKIPELARRQVALGAVGITCQKLGEAEVMADAGIDDILLTFNLLGRAKLHRLVALARRVRLSVTLDNAVVASELDAAMREAGLRPAGAGRVRYRGGALRRADAGGSRRARPAGRRPEGAAPRWPDDLSRPRPDPGHRRLARRGRRRTARRRHRARRGQHRRHARPVPRARGHRRHRAPAWHLHLPRPRPGARAGNLDDCAMRVLATVVSRPTDGRAILDTGSKTLSSDTVGLDGFGLSSSTRSWCWPSSARSTAMSTAAPATPGRISASG